MASMVNQHTGSNKTPVMQSSSWQGSSASQVRRQSSTGNRSRAASFTNAGYEFSENFEYQTDSNGHIIFPTLPDYDMSLFDEPAMLGADAVTNAFDYGLLPTFKAAVPGAGTPAQQSWEGINNADDNIADQMNYPDPQDAHSQNQGPYHFQYYQNQMPFRLPQQYVPAAIQQSQMGSNAVQAELYMPLFQAEETYNPAPSQQRKRSRGASDADLEEAGIYYKKARIQENDSGVVSRASRSTSGTSVSEISNANERMMLKKSREVKKRASGGVEYLYEKPKLDDKKDWVRINASTKGMTTRTAKINHYQAEYEERDHPVGDWQGTKFFHQYTKHGEFLNKRGGVMSAKQIKEFILEYPNRDPKYPGAKLKLWIQRGPTDCARRYKSATWAKCRFEECPAQKYQTGTILHGHYRVSFDEKWHRDRENVDPLLTAGYVHLYCMERFLDLSEICRKADVEVDTRQLTNEPRGKWAATLANQPECAIAQKFVSAAFHRHGLDELSEFANYPKHDQHKIIRNGKTTYHKNTLTYHMHNRKETSRPPAQQAQFQQRGLGDTHISKHLGDLEMLFQASSNRKKNNRLAKKQKKRATYVEDEEEEDEDDNEPEVAPRSSRRPARRTTRKQYAEEPNFDEEGEAETDEEALFLRNNRKPEPRPMQLQLPQNLTAEQVKELYAMVMANEQAAHVLHPRQTSNGNLLVGIDNHLAEQNTGEDAIDPTLNNYNNVSPKSMTLRQNSGIGTFPVDGEYDIDSLFDDVEDNEDEHPLQRRRSRLSMSKSMMQKPATPRTSGLDDTEDNEDEYPLQRRRSRLNMSKSIMKKPTTPRISGSSSRRVSIGQTTTRKFFKTQSPHTVSFEGRRHSQRLQNKSGK